MHPANGAMSVGVDGCYCVPLAYMVASQDVKLGHLDHVADSTCFLVRGSCLGHVHGQFFDLDAGSVEDDLLIQSCCRRW